MSAHPLTHCCSLPCRLLDVRTGTCSSYGHSLVVYKGKIDEIDAQVPPDRAVVLNCGGLLLMPGWLSECSSRSPLIVQVSLYTCMLQL